MMTDIAITIEHLSKAYRLYEKPLDRLKESLHPFRKVYHKDFHALHDVSFEIKKGEAVGIIGKNGSGKSTLLKILAGVLTPTSGNVITTGRISALLELGTGFNPEFTGLENIYFSGTIMGYHKEEMDAKLQGIIDFADIGEFIEQPVKTYSSGMFVRLAFAVAVNIDPEILIVDEALAVGDMRFQQKCIRKMQNFVEQGKTILLVTHDITAIRTYCSRAIWLRDGKLFEKGDPKVVTTHYHHYMHFGLEPNKNKQKQTEHTDAIANISTSSDVKIAHKNIDWVNVTGYDSSGEGGVVIKQVSLCTVAPLKSTTLLAGGERVNFIAEIDVTADIQSPLIGLILYNNYGIAAIHMNNNIFENILPPLKSGENIYASFEFTLPRLANGDYTFSMGVVDGTHENHVILQRIHEAYTIKILDKDIISTRQSGYIIIDDAYISINHK